MIERLTGRLGLLLVMLSLAAASVPAQVTTSGRLTGVVADANGALIPKAQVTAKHDQTQTEYKTTTNEEGGWTIPSVPNGTYTITITGPGFKTTVTKDVKVDTGQATTLNTALETGGATEQVVVTGGADVLQKESATIATTIVGRQIGELPFSTRDALTLITTLPGVSSPGVPRASTINGLPKGSVNLTLDGANIQDNFLRSSDGFFTTIQAKSDAVQEVTVSTAVPGAESGGEGAVQVRFTTKSGSPEFHGGAFWQYRSKTFNSNYYFNNIDGLPRDAFILRQFGGNIGGPIFIPKLMKSRDKAFFFVNYEYFTLPQAYGNDVTGNTLVATPDARRGIFTYPDTAGTLRQIDLLQLVVSKCGTLPAGTACPSTVDPRVAAGLGLVDGYVHSAGSLTSRISTQSPGDYNRLDYNFQDPGKNIRWFPTARFDYNLSSKHHLEFIHNYQHYFSNPDGVNGQLDVYPGSGIVVGSPGTTGSIHRNSFSFVAAHRWTVNDRLINEVRATSSGNGTSLFTQEFAPGLYSAWGGYAVNAGTYLGPQSLGTGPFYTRRSQSRRNTPVKGLSDNLNMLKGVHTINLGFAFTRVASFTQAVDTQVVPQIVFGVDANDPVVNVFSSTNLPGSSSAQRTQAQQLYALVTGRISAINRSASLNEATRAYDFIPFTERNHQNEFAYYAQDTWKARQNLTLSYGLRWEIDPSPINDNLIYTRTGSEGVFGVSGNGNIFNPKVITNTPTFFRLLDPGEKGYRTRHKDFAPTIGFAWSPSFKSGLLHTIFGSGDQTVFRGGYGTAYTREGFNAYTSMFGSNNGPTINLNATPATTPGIFKAGAVLFRDPSSYPLIAPPADTSRFPLLAGGSASVNDFDPNLKPGYTQSYSFGLQRELDKNTAVEVRYVGTHGTHLWRQYNYNEVNIFENGFLDVFKAAANNLAISRAAGRGDNYGNQNLPGQVNVPLITTAIGGSAAATNTTVVTQLQQGQAGAVANGIATSASRMNNLIAAGLVPFVTLPDGSKVSNFFVMNPQAVTGGAFLMTNGVDTQFHALQIEVRRRLSNGLLVQGSYQYGKALSNSYGSSSAVATQPRTLRDLNQDWGLSPWDLRHSFKLDWLYELPIGPGRAFLNGHTPVISKVLEGWQTGGVARIQTGPVFLMTSGRATFNQNDSGVVLHNISTKQLQDLVKIRKETVCAAGVCRGVVFWLPDSIIQNSLAAFDLGKGLASLDPNAPYIGPQTEPGKLGNRIFLHGPMTARFDLNLVKRTRITERVNFEARMQLLNAFNRANFYILSATADARTAAVNSSSFGQTRAAYRDFTVSGTNDPGGRLIEFQFRLNF
ncbi:MAG TPA: carboxypeptidase regulatory-like domain-containing protein [Blastocatellia bacterium]|nr:carboxypeptidase regulatory-like domain-containing protein [Blastocatellia bacterium]